MIDKNAVPTKFLWVDLEMTGLDVEKDVIIEVAAEVTDVHFKTLASYEAIIFQSDAKLAAANEWARDQHDKSGLTDRVRNEGRPEQQIVQEFTTFIKENFGGEPAILAGNSIHNDRNFVKKWWPEVEQLLHYRMLDVSTFKIVMMAKFGIQFEKNDAHRAFDDIQASIAELQYYLDYLQNQ